MDTYKVKFNPETDKGIYALSIVEDPAMEGMFITLTKDEKIEVKLTTVDKEQKILLGVALIPNKPIYRNIEGKEFNIVFDSETIKESAHYFLKNQNNNNSTIEHEVKLSGMSVVESWIVEDETHDKQKKYGFDYPVGSWLVKMKVNDESIWNDYVKTGKVKGFSIDGLFSLEKLKLSNINMSDNKTILESIQSGLAELKADFKALFSKEKEVEEIKLGSIPVKDSETSVYFEGEMLAEGQPVFTDEAMETPAPDGEHQLETGITITVKDGLVESMKEEEAPEQTEEVEMNDDTSIKEQLEALVAQLSTMKTDIETFKAEKEAEVLKLKADLDAKNKEVLELSQTPATKPIKNAPKKVELSAVKKENKFYQILQNNK